MRNEDKALDARRWSLAPLRLASRKSTGKARLAGLAGFLKRHLQACLRGDLQKGRSIRAANNSRNFSASPSVLIRAIRG